MRIVAIAVMCVSSMLLHAEQDSHQRAKKILLHAAQHFALYDDELRKLKEIDQPIAVLADFLKDKKLSPWAVKAMMRLDLTAAASVLLQNLQSIDLNESRVFDFYLQEGLTNSMPWRSDLHQAALQVLQAGEDSEKAIHMLGLTGDANDIPLLEKIYDRTHSEASESSLARLGSVSHLDNIESDLGATLLFEKREKKSFNQVEKQIAVIEAAGFSANKRFIPLLCQHLKDSVVLEGNDFLIVPGGAAATALSLIVDRKFSSAPTDSKPEAIGFGPHTYWVTRCKAFQ